MPDPPRSFLGWQNLPLLAGFAGLVAIAGPALDPGAFDLEDRTRTGIRVIVAIGLTAGVIAAAIDDRRADGRLRGACILAATLLLTSATYVGALSIGFLFAPAAILWLLIALRFLWQRRESGLLSSGFAGLGVGLLGLVLVQIVFYVGALSVWQIIQLA